MDDDELITRLAGGDDRALRELFSRHAPVLAVRLRTVLPPSDVEDVLQETFLAAWKGASHTSPTPRPAAGCGGSPVGRPRCCFAAGARAAAPLPDLFTAGLPGPLTPNDLSTRSATKAEIAGRGREPESG